MNMRLAVVAWTCEMQTDSANVCSVNVAVTD